MRARADRGKRRRHQTRDEAIRKERGFAVSANRLQSRIECGDRTLLWTLVNRDYVQAMAGVGDGDHTGRSASPPPQ